MNIKKINEQNFEAEGRYYTHEHYECGRYKILKITSKEKEHGWVYETFSVKVSDKDRLLPMIYYNDWSCIDETAKPKFTIQTTSYGDLDPKEIRKVIKGYEKAIEVVEALTKTFIEQEEDNNSHDAYLAFVLGYDLLHDELANSDNPENDLCFEHCLNLVKEFKKSDEFKDLSMSEYEALREWLNNRA